MQIACSPLFLGVVHYRSLCGDLTIVLISVNIDKRLKAGIEYSLIISIWLMLKLCLLCFHLFFSIGMFRLRPSSQELLQHLRKQPLHRWELLSWHFCRWGPFVFNFSTSQSTETIVRTVRGNMIQAKTFELQILAFFVILWDWWK